MILLFISDHLRACINVTASPLSLGLMYTARLQFVLYLVEIGQNLKIRSNLKKECNISTSIL